MNADTGHLIDTKDFDKAALQALSKQGYEEVPKKLVHAANRLLAQKKDAYVDLLGGSSLARHAMKLRKKKRRMQKASRKRSR